MASHGHGGHDPHTGGGVDPNFVNDKNYETRDVSLNTLVPWLFFLFVFVGVSAVVTLIMYRFVFRIGYPDTSAYALPHVRELPRMRLQANPVQEIKQYRLDEDAILNHYGKDPKTGAIHIPIERAMDMVIQEGLPTRAVPGPLDAQEPNEPSRMQGQAPPGSEAGTGNTSSGQPTNQTSLSPNPTGQPSLSTPGGGTITPSGSNIPPGNASGSTTP